MTVREIFHHIQYTRPITCYVLLSVQAVLYDSMRNIASYSVHTSNNVLCTVVGAGCAI